MVCEGAQSSIDKDLVVSLGRCSKANDTGNREYHFVSGGIDWLLWVLDNFLKRLRDGLHDIPLRWKLILSPMDLNTARIERSMRAPSSQRFRLISFDGVELRC